MTTTYVRVFLKGGTVSHYLEPRHQQRNVRYVLCQRSSDRWLGSTERQREHGQALPVCEKCQERAELAGAR